MKRISRLGVWLCGLPLSFPPASSQALVERGKYLVEHLAHCGDCHTRLMPEGKRYTANVLKGAHSQLTTPRHHFRRSFMESVAGTRICEVFEDGYRAGRTTIPAAHAGIQTAAG
jgi:hypothetical protein